MTNIPLMWTPLVQRQFRRNSQAQNCLQLCIHNICMHRLLKPPVFLLFLYITHTHARKCTHILDTHTHISSATVATAAAVGCHHWSCLHTFDPFGWELYCWRRKNSKTELMCVFVLHGRGEPFFSPSTNRKTLAAFSQDRGRQWQRERSQSDIDLNQTNPPLVPM